jgi:HD-GYP domain-containing protein (c-di-GMP phosphodiesterase class II)
VATLDDDTEPELAGGDVSGGDPAGATVEALARALELHDYRSGSFGETGTHLRRVTQLGVALARAVEPLLVADPQLEHGFRLHDIGMIAVPNAIRLKHGPLSPDELTEMREHPWLGERIIAPLPSLSGLARQVIASHHERWDGSGYPRGLAATDIPLGARIFAVIDAFDAMTRDQPYRHAIPDQLALTEIREKAGSQFDPTIAAEFIELWPELEGESGAPDAES